MTIDTGNKTRVPTVRQIKCFIKIEREGKMKKLFRNSLIASVVAVAGATTFAGEANAQSVDVDFSGTIGNTCEITKIKDGKVGVRGDSPGILIANPSLALEPSQVEFGVVEINCSNSGTIQVGQVTATSADAQTLASQSGSSLLNYVFDNPNGDSSSIIADTDDGTARSNTVGINPNGTPQQYYIGIGAQGTSSSTPIPPGQYAYSATISVTPQ